MDATEVRNSDFCVFLNAALQRGQVYVKWGVVRHASDYDEAYYDTHAGTGTTYIEWDEGENALIVVRNGQDHPAASVGWHGAAAYCNWRSEQEGLEPAYDLETWKCDFRAGGYRLPTEAEWEYAARGDLRYAMYPWGNDIDGTRANYRQSGDPYDSVWPSTTPVGSFPPNSYGLYDMAGNAKELCHDWFDPYYYQYCVDNGTVDNPRGPATDPWGKGIRVVRGGSAYDYEEDLRCSLRSGGGSYPGYYLGFRCVRRPRSP
jgi:formylglycine-generating enzyme required for sulfatase activity